jgi:hypothetical protein
LSLLEPPFSIVYRIFERFVGDTFVKQHRIIVKVRKERATLGGPKRIAKILLLTQS